MEDGAKMDNEQRSKSVLKKTGEKKLKSKLLKVQNLDYLG
jgi:hypothetical protein